MSRAFCWNEGMKFACCCARRTSCRAVWSASAPRSTSSTSLRRRAAGPALTGATALFHLAATNTTSQVGADLVERSTVTLTESVLAAAGLAGVSTVVYTSSVVVLGRSSHPARLLNESDTTTSAESPYVAWQGGGGTGGGARRRLRAGTCGSCTLPGSSAPDDAKLTPPHRLILQAVEKGQRFSFDGGVSVAHVEEVAAAHVAAWEKGQAGGRYVLGGQNVTFKQFYDLLARLSGHAAPALRLPKAVLLGGARRS